jgi:hypothetical protein
MEKVASLVEFRSRLMRSSRQSARSSPAPSAALPSETGSTSRSPRSSRQGARRGTGPLGSLISLNLVQAVFGISAFVGSGGDPIVGSGRGWATGLSDFPVIADRPSRLHCNGHQQYAPMLGRHAGGAACILRRAKDAPVYDREPSRLVDPDGLACSPDSSNYLLLREIWRASWRSSSTCDC